MKKRILVAIYSLGNGGGEKALVNMLNSLSPEKYIIDLQMFEKKGINLQFVPDWINILPPLFPNGMLSSKQQLKILLHKKDFAGIREKCINLITSPKKNDRYKTLVAWKTLKRICPKNHNEYDIVVSAMHGLSTYYAFDMITAKKKICWVHTDYSKIPLVKEDEEYFLEANHVVTVSEQCVKSLKNAFPRLDNISLLFNLNCPDLIYQMANGSSKDECFKRNRRYNFVSVGRLIPLKGFDMAIEAAEILKSKGYSFEWTVLGEGFQKEELEHLAVAKGVSDDILFIGSKSNPYPYYKHADIVIQTSRYEGKSMVLDEAKILNKPIVVTAYDSVYDQIVDEENGIIANMSGASVADAIVRILENKSLQKKIIGNLESMSNAQSGLLAEYDRLFS